MLSIVPNSDQKLSLVDKSKGLSIELRKFPALTLLINLTSAYPSKQAPLFQIVQSPFYKIFDKQIILGLGERWAEGNPCLYDCFCYI
jgi:hypothetical protein